MSVVAAIEATSGFHVITAGSTYLDSCDQEILAGATHFTSPSVDATFESAVFAPHLANSKEVKDPELVIREMEPGHMVAADRPLSGTRWLCKKGLLMDTLFASLLTTTPVSSVGTSNSADVTQAIAAATALFALLYVAYLITRVVFLVTKLFTTMAGLVTTLIIMVALVIGWLNR